MPADANDNSSKVLEGLSDSVLEAADRARIGVAVTLVEPAGPRNVYLNEAAVQILGFPREELMRRPALSNIAPEERERLVGLVRQRLAGGLGPGRVETVVLTQAGQRVPIVTVATQLLINGIQATVSFFWDITDRVTAEEGRRAEADRLRRLVDSAPDGILLVRGEVILMANPAGARLVGESDPKSLVGRRLSTIVRAEDVELMRHRMQRASAGETLGPGEYRLNRLDGTAAVAEVTSLPFEHEGQPALLAFVRDVTESTAVRQQLAASEQLAALGTLAAGIAHEINNPLAAATLLTELVEKRLRAGRPAEEVLSAIAELRQMQDRIGFIVRDLKAVSRAEPDKREPVDLCRVFGVVERMLASAIKGKATLSFELAGLPLVEGNTVRLEQVFINLVLNALQALPENRATNALQVRGRVVPDGRVCVEVIDNGGGIAPEHLERVFAPFFTTKPLGVGTGLGLTISRDLVTRMGGDVQVSSVLGQGTTVRVLLQVAGASAAVVVSSAPVPQGRRPTVLLIDDEVAIARTLHGLLKERHEVELCSDPQAAISRLVTGAVPDVVLCDLMMPKVTGMDVYREVVERRPDLAQRFVFMSGGAYTSAAAEFLARVQPPMIQKPFRISDLEKVFAELLARQLVR